MKRFNGLTPEEDERLSLLAEECSEVIQAVMKIKRHGYDSHHPRGGPDNRRHLEKELGHLRLATCLMIDRGDVWEEEIEIALDDKALEIDQYLHHNTVKRS